MQANQLLQFLLVLVFVLGFGSTTAFELPTLTILYTGELNGSIQPRLCNPTQFSGLARRASLIQSIRETEQWVLLIDNGSLISEAGWLGELQYGIAILAMNEMGYDALNIGDHDLLLTPDHLQEIQQQYGFRILSANLYAQGVGQLGQHSLIQTYKSGDVTLKVGITGICSPKFAPEVEVDNPNIVFADIHKSLESVLSDLRQKVDLIVVLAHVAPEEAAELVRKFSSIDVLITSHEKLSPPDNPFKIGETILLNGNTSSQYLGRLDLTFDSTKKITNHRYEMLAITSDTPQSPEIVQIIQSHDAKLASEDPLSFEAEKTRFPGGGFFVGAEKCIECHESAFAVWEKSAHAKAYLPVRQHRREYDISCLNCHATGFGYIGGFRDGEQTPQFANVGCEECHGAGSDHLVNNYQDYGKVTEAKCRSCHDAESSPQFDYEAAQKAIQH